MNENKIRTNKRMNRERKKNDRTNEKRKVWMEI